LNIQNYSDKILFGFSCKPEIEERKIRLNGSKNHVFLRNVHSYDRNYILYEHNYICYGANLICYESPKTCFFWWKNTVSDL